MAFPKLNSTHILDSLEKNDPHLSPVTADSLLSRLNSRRLRRVVLAKGLFSPDPAKSERVLLYSCRGSRLFKLSDAWLTPEGCHRLRSELKNRCLVLDGESDAMYATREKYIWAVENAGEGAELKLWSGRRLIGRFNPREIKLRRSRSPFWRRVSASSVVRARARVSPGWMLRTVDLQLTWGRRVAIATEVTVWPLFDPTFDRLELSGETAWLVKLTQAIAENAGIPFELHKDL